MKSEPVPTRIHALVVLTLVASCGPATSTNDEASTTSAATETATGPGSSVDTGPDPDTTAGASSPPLADGDEYFAERGEVLSTPAAQGLLTNDTDPDGDSLQVVAGAVVSTRGAEVELSADGAFSYQAPPEFWGWDDFEYAVQDPEGHTSTARVTIHVLARQLLLGEVAAGVGGFAFEGSASEYAGNWLAGPGDVNGDGVADLMIGASRGGPDLAVSGEGRVYVVYGAPRTGVTRLADVGDGGFMIDGYAEEEKVGWRVAGAGDVDGDGLADMILGTFWSPFGGDPGRAYLVFGAPEPAVVDLSIPGPHVDFVGEPGDQAGRGVSGAGDVNGDGLTDLIIGAPLADALGAHSGRAYVVFGGTDLSSLDLATLGDGGFTIDGVGEDRWVGYAVAGVGDVDGDGLDDVAVSDHLGGGLGVPGAVHVVFGKTDATTVRVDTLGDGGFSVHGEIAGDYLGQSVAGAGDVDGDGRPDLLIGAPGFSPDGAVPAPGRAYVVFGKADTAPVELASLGDQGLVLDAGAGTGSTGQIVAGAGDFNGDGLDDVLLGATADGALPIAFLVFGGTAPSTLSLDNLGDRGVVMVAEPDYQNLSGEGMAVAGIGDINDDGLGDVAVADFSQAPGGSNRGRIWVVYGVRTVAP